MIIVLFLDRKTTVLNTSIIFQILKDMSQEEFINLIPTAFIGVSFKTKIIVLLFPSSMEKYFLHQNKKEMIFDSPITLNTYIFQNANYSKTVNQIKNNNRKILNTFLMK